MEDRHPLNDFTDGVMVVLMAMPFNYVNICIARLSILMSPPGKRRNGMVDESRN
jgi:hypothetical protein